jgi:hypothetical protein
MKEVQILSLTAGSLSFRLLLFNIIFLKGVVGKRYFDWQTVRCRVRAPERLLSLFTLSLISFLNDAVEQCYFGQSRPVKTGKVAGSSPAFLQNNL